MLQLTKDCISWIKNHFKSTGAEYAIIGISGGKDSTICAALLTAALGADKVIGVLMPNGSQSDIDDSWRVKDLLELRCHLINIGPSFESLTGSIINGAIYDSDPNHPCGRYMNVQEAHQVLTNDTINTNLPSRLRMATLYAVAALYPNSRVVNTSNFSEIYVGYSTKWGDGVGDFGPLRKLTVSEVLSIGDDLGLPYELVHKVPSDGMSGKSDEEKLGVSYTDIDNYIMYVDEVEESVAKKIEYLHNMNIHKVNPIAEFNPYGRG